MTKRPLLADDSLIGRLESPDSVRCVAHIEGDRLVLQLEDRAQRKCWATLTLDLAGPEVWTTVGPEADDEPDEGDILDFDPDQPIPYRLA